MKPKLKPIKTPLYRHDFRRMLFSILGMLGFASLLLTASSSSGYVGALSRAPSYGEATLEQPAIATGVLYLPVIQREGFAKDTPVPVPTPVPTPVQSPITETFLGIWISSSELAKLPTTGPAWDQLLSKAQEPGGNPDLSNQNDVNNILYLAKALVYARTGDPALRDQVENALEFIVSKNTEAGGTTLALGRKLLAYVIAADLINLPDKNPDLDVKFRARLQELLSKPLSGSDDTQRTLQGTHEGRANNWGTHAGASRAAVAVYLGDTAELERTAQVFRGFLGDYNAYHGFKFDDDLSWQCDPAIPVGINPKGCSKGGHSIDGALPEEMRRGGKFRWPPKKTNYPWGGLQGALAQAEILHRAGYPAWEWEDQALLRAAQFLYGIGWDPEGDDEWQPWLINHAYGTHYPASLPAKPGKNMGWTDWTHSKP